MPYPNQNPNVFDGPGQDESFYPKPPSHWVDVLRNYLRDFAPKNILRNQEFESTPEQLELAWGLALMHWNQTPPTFGAVGFLNHPKRLFLLYKAAIEVVRMVSFELMRNELDYTDGDERYNINSQYRAMLDWATRLDTEYKDLLSKAKTEINASAGWGGSTSEFGLHLSQLNRASAGLD